MGSDDVRGVVLTVDSGDVEQEHTSGVEQEAGLRASNFKWEGLLEFLNNEKCYVDESKVEPLESCTGSATTFLTLPSTIYSGRTAWRRFYAMFESARHMRRLPPHVPLARARNRVGDVVLAPAVQAFIGLMACIDVVLTFITLLRNLDGVTITDLVLSVVSVFVFIVVALEVLARMFHFGWRFTHSILNLFELAVIPLALFNFSTALVETNANNRWAVLRALRPFARGLNLCLKVARGYNRLMQFRSKIQLQVNGSSRRHRADGYDLDLCYVTKHRIAMGRPAVGSDSLYNNPVSEVARFLDEKHMNKYLVVCVNDQCDYRVFHFHGRVLLFPVPAASVPKLADLWRLCASLQEYLDRDKSHVCAVHTKFGSGRVGMIIAATLLYGNHFQHAGEAVHHFERRRTDPFSRNIVSGVDCASQLRFIEYFAACVQDFRGVPDPPRRVRLRNIKVLGVEPELASDLVIRCFGHTLGTAPRPLFDDEQLYASRSSTLGIEPDVMSVDPRGFAAMMLLLQAETAVEMARREAKMQEFDSVYSGCERQLGVPLLDTATDTKVLSSDDTSYCGSMVWQIDNLDLAGEICFEIHRRRPPSDRAADDEADSTQFLFATWLHTSFLEISGDMHNNGPTRTLSNKGATAVCVSLQRFDFDKGKEAPSLGSYGSSFQMQLLFDVDEPIVFRETASQGYNTMANVKERALKLIPPSPDNVSEAFPIDWLTWCVSKLWKHIEEALRQLLHAEVERQLREIGPARLGGDFGVFLESFCLGDNTPEFESIVCSQRSGEHAGIQLDIEIRYDGDANIVVGLGATRVGVTRLTLDGTLSLLFNPVVSQMPIIGGLHMFFLNPPRVAFHFAGFAEVVEHTLLQSLVLDAMDAALAHALVLPNVLTINWMPETFESGDQSTCLSTAVPMGALHVEVLDVDHASITTFCSRNCNPRLLKACGDGPRRFVVVRLGAFKHQAAQCLCSCCFLMYDLRQNLALEVREQDLGRSRLLGRTRNLVVAPLHESGGETIMNGECHEVERCLPLQDMDAEVPDEAAPKIKLRVRLFQLHADRERLEACIGSSCGDAAGGTSAASRPPRDERVPFTAVWEAVPEVREVGVRRSEEAVGTRGSMKLPASAPLVSAGSIPLAFVRPQATPIVALLVCSLKKASLPEEHPASEYMLHTRVGEQECRHAFAERDLSWRTTLKVSDSTAATIEALAKEGFTAERIAMRMKMDKVLVSKVVAHRFGYNAELRQKLYVLVEQAALVGDGRVELEVRRRGSIVASRHLPLEAVRSSKLLRLRRVVELHPMADTLVSSSPISGGAPLHRFDLDVDLQLLAFVPHNDPRAGEACDEMV